MSQKFWTLVNHATGECDFNLAIGPNDFGKAAGFRVAARELRGGRRNGVQMVEIDNGICQFTVVPTRGMAIWKAAVGDVIAGWNSPVQGPVHPAFVHLGEPSGLGWLDGFDELLARCGLHSNGAPEFDQRGVLKYPLHGRIANLPAQHVELTIDEDAGELTLVGIVDECRFHFQKLRLTSTIKTKLGEPGWRITDEVTNLSGEPGEAQLLYHINFGPPLLEPGAKLIAPAQTVVPRNELAAAELAHWSDYGPPEAGSQERVFLFELAADAARWTQVLLRNAAADRGATLRFSTENLPCFTQWKNTPSLADGYVTGLEPGTNFPNPRSFEARQGRVLQLEPGATARFELALELHDTAAGVQTSAAKIRTLPAPLPPHLHARPQAGWCAP
ncbi:MAG TPA: aldose 1-epimerase family protein [Pirellulales bacterium]|jgi:galactose mutarotase-like enzyme|nr:aldose 1-epimerase family protein [Pirellulales bacterium]